MNRLTVLIVAQAVRNLSYKDKTRLRGFQNLYFPLVRGDSLIDVNRRSENPC